MWVTVDFLRVDRRLPYLLRVPVDRQQPAKPIDAAVAASRRLPDHSADAVVITSERLTGDGLASSPLAASKHGPVLLTPPDSLPPAVLGEAARVARAGAAAYVLGDTSAIAAAVDQQLFGAGLLPIRVAGADRYATAALVALFVNPAPTEVLIASADSLSDVAVAGEAAGARGEPLLLVNHDGVPAATAMYLALNPAAKRIVVGNVNSVPASVAAALGSTDRVSGRDASDTSGAVAARFFSGATRLIMTEAARPVDAFLLASEAAIANQAILLTGGGAPDALYSYVSDRIAKWTGAELLARPATFDDDTLVLLFS
jgi:putative cell wall-binding protein